MSDERRFPRLDARTEYDGTTRCPCCGDSVRLRVRVTGDTEQLEQVMIEEVTDE